MSLLNQYYKRTPLDYKGIIRELPAKRDKYIDLTGVARLEIDWGVLRFINRIRLGYNDINSLLGKMSDLAGDINLDIAKIETGLGSLANRIYTNDSALEEHKKEGDIIINSLSARVECAKKIMNSVVSGLSNKERFVTSINLSAAYPALKHETLRVLDTLEGYVISAVKEVTHNA